MTDENRRIEIEFYDSVTMESLGSHTSPLRRIDLIRRKHSKYVKVYKEIMTNTYRRCGILIGDIKTKIRVYTP